MTYNSSSENSTYYFVEIADEMVAPSNLPYRVRLSPAWTANSSLFSVPHGSFSFFLSHFPLDSSLLTTSSFPPLHPTKIRKSPDLKEKEETFQVPSPRPQSCGHSSFNFRICVMYDKSQPTITGNYSNYNSITGVLLQSIILEAVRTSTNLKSVRYFLSY